MLNRREFILGTFGATLAPRPKPLCLIRYDTEQSWNPQKMEGFLAKAVAIHRKHKIPITFFCTGGAIEAREKEFRAFSKEIKDDPLFDIQDHSYSHIGLGYAKGKSVDLLKADYEKSFAAHERVIGARPIGIARCGTSGKDGPSLRGFDATEKSRAEFEMIAGLGVRMFNSFLTDVANHKAFSNYAKLGHPKIMGFPSGNSDTSWLVKKEPKEAVKKFLGVVEATAARKDHLPVMHHDWAAWNHGPDRELTHVVQIADKARELGYELSTHIACFKNESLWK